MKRPLFPNSTLLTLLLIALSSGGGGCTATNEIFEGYPADQVWTSLVTVANTPDYSDRDPSKRWTVLRNEVWSSREQGRIEIYRELKRILHQPGTKSRLESRTWELSILFSEDSTNSSHTIPPTAIFTYRNFHIPAHGLLEARRYFRDVRKLLGPRPDWTLPEETPAPDPVATPLGDLEIPEPPVSTQPTQTEETPILENPDSPDSPDSPTPPEALDPLLDDILDNPPVVDAHTSQPDIAIRTPPNSIPMVAIIPPIEFVDYPLMWQWLIIPKK